MLDLVQSALELENFQYCRLDGSMNIQQRENIMQDFRSNANTRILLASIQSAGVGLVLLCQHDHVSADSTSTRLDLTAASRVHLLEPQWNPLSEEQALDRVHRMGQTQSVKAYRYIMKDSIDEVRP